jgi:HK97 family phage major capsid protein
MLADHQAYLARVAGADVLIIERRDAPTLTTVAEAIAKINETFEEFKRTNDKRLAELKAGASTADQDAKLAKLEQDIEALSEQKARLEKLETRLSRPGAGASAATGGEPASAEELAHRAAFTSWLRQPGDVERRNALQRAEREMRKAARNRDLADSLDEWDREMRAAQATTQTGAAGGFALPEMIEAQIAQLGVDESPMRSLATVRTVGSTDYKELFDVNGAGFEWVGEGDSRNQTNTADLAEVQPTWGMASARPFATEESLEDLFFNVESWLTDSAGRALGVGEGAAYFAGNGTKKPTGLLAATVVSTGDASRAFGSLQYVASGAASTLPTSLDTMYDLIYALRQRYRRNARWVANRLTYAGFRKYKDTTGAYLWQPAVTAGQPDMFMGYPTEEAEDMPVVAANALPVAFGDFREGYLICDRPGMRITRDEITTPGLVKFYVRRRTAGKVRNSQAIKLLKIAAS